MRLCLASCTQNLVNLSPPPPSLPSCTPGTYRLLLVMNSMLVTNPGSMNGMSQKLKWPVPWILHAHRIMSARESTPRARA